VFRIDPATDALAPTGHTVAIARPVGGVLMAPPV